MGSLHLALDEFNERNMIITLKLYICIMKKSIWKTDEVKYIH